MTEWNEPPDPAEEGPGAAMFVYVLLLSSLLFMVTAVIAVVVAYIYRDQAPAWLGSHYRLQVRTFWISIPFFAVGFLLSPIYIGFLILLVWLVWFLARCIKGIRYLSMRRPYPHPESWWI